MSYSKMFMAAVTLTLVLPAQASEVRVRAMHVTPVVTPEMEHAPSIEIAPQPGRRERAVTADGAAREVGADENGIITDGPSTLLLYPVAGQIALDGGDLSIPYYVDLDPSDVRRDYDCTDLTFNRHEGHDPYIRSFREQEIGVPVFAVLDGTVIDVRDGEPDENTGNDPGMRANYITLRHANNMTTQYVHLRRGSMLPVGTFVAAGTQVGLVGSSGMSTAPHAHFEVRYNNEAFEPMAGPCRPGRSFFDTPVPPKSAEFALVGATFSTVSFENVRPAPYDDAPHTGTFLRGLQTIYFKADVANVGATTHYELHLRRPGSIDTIPVANGRLISYDASLAAVWWALDVNLDVTGTWTMVLDVDGKHTYTRPFL
ncbi:MAG TPA: M23 family metallopeptidase, partial [Thermoanaerobaculia bacterium]